MALDPRSQAGTIRADPNPVGDSVPSLETGEGNPQCDLARAIGVEAPSLVRTLGQLEAQGLVERRACDDDRRSKRLYLTPAAIPLLEQIDSVVLAARQEMLAGLSEQDLDQLDKWLALIESNGLAIQTRDQDSPTA